MQVKGPRVRREGSRLLFNNLDHIAAVSDFQRAVYDGLRQGFTEYTLQFIGTDRFFPNAVVPIAAYLDLYSAEGVKFSVKHAPWRLVRAKLLSPITTQSATNREKLSPTSVVWKFEEASQVNQIVTDFVHALSTIHICAAGVLESFEWCLNEIMDNVLQHSDGSPGFVMMQVHAQSERVAICIADHGRGLLSSLQQSKYRPATELDAITIAIKPGVTRDPNIGQGNGLWGLSEIIQRNKGRLNIVSGRAALYFDGKETKSFSNLPSHWSKAGAVVDFQINTDSPIHVSEALGGGAYQHVNIRMEEMQIGVSEYLVNVQSVSHGTGTRRSGERVRNFVLNIFSEGASRVVLDFNGVGMVSSSFADEVVGKLVAQFGFSGFNQKVAMKNANATVRSLIDYSVQQRLMTQLQLGGSSSESGSGSK
jgi:anti-sigma regulatory factor (Ser/Thr protein kinase)